MESRGQLRDFPKPIALTEYDAKGSVALFMGKVGQKKYIDEDIRFSKKREAYYKATVSGAFVVIF